MRPVLCMITDRQRLDPPGEATLVSRVAAAAAAGVHLVQVRERDLDTVSLLRLVRRCVDAAAGRSRIIVNDRVDVALAAGAHGVHLRGDSMPANRARGIVPRGFLIGRSIHAAGEADGESTDYLLFGTVFETASKAGRPAAGAARLREAAATSPVPVLAVGGVTLGRVSEIARTGASGLAAIGLFAATTDAAIAAVVAAVNQAFDSAASSS
jgi:thiamine-phosphate pyrophosphorylase